MPKQTGLIKLKGTLNGTCYYKLNNVHIERKATGPSKERINNDPAFAAVKANTQEFGGASILSRALRTGLNQQIMTFKDSYMSSRLSGVCRAIIAKGSGMPGQREASLFNAPAMLIGFQMLKAQPFGQIYNAKPSISINRTRTTIQIHIAQSKPNHLKRRPKSATHFRLTAALSVVSCYQWVQDAYQPIYPSANGLGAAEQSNPLQCNAEHLDIHFNIHSPIATDLPENVAITVWLGIQYGTSSANEFIPISTVHAMECVGVF
ncbi:MAG: hypothetical protein ACSHXF_14635 [Aquaticitalea sp.]